MIPGPGEDYLDFIPQALRREEKRFQRWRQIHRFFAIAITLAIAGLPSIVALGVVVDDSHGKLLLWAAAALTAIVATYRPATLSQARRDDVATMGELYADFKSVETEKDAIEFFKNRYLAAYRHRRWTLIDRVMMTNETHARRTRDAREAKEDSSQPSSTDPRGPWR